MLFAHIPDPRGPIPLVIEQRLVRSEVKAGRVTVPQYKFGAPPALPLPPSWIWVDGQPAAVHFRKTVSLPQKPAIADLWFSADAHARIYVNGLLVARGPDDGGQDYPGTQTGRTFVCHRDLARFFHAGQNVISAEVFNAQAMEGRYNSSGHGGLMIEARFRNPGTPDQTISTDPTWRGRAAREWRFAQDALQFDGNQEEPGWRTESFNDSQWPRCQVTESHWPRLELSQIPPRLEATYPSTGITQATAAVSIQGNAVTFSQNGSCRVDFDRVLSGFVGVKVEGAKGDVLAIQMTEPKKPGFNRMATVLLRDGVQTLELPFYDGFSAINLVAKSVTKPLKVLDVRANFVAQPVTYRGDFLCSDEALNHVWQTSQWLTQICQQTHHLDSPDHQEPICDPGDYLIISLNNAYAFGQPELARQDLRKYAWLLEATGYRPFHTSYALLWLQMLMAYERYTGDTALVTELTPTVYRLIDQFLTYRGANGILSQAPDYMFMDWVTIGGFEAHHPPAVIGQGYMTAFFYRALADGAEVAKLAHDSARVSRYEALRSEIRDAYNHELWDETAELYRDGKPFVNTQPTGPWRPADVDIVTHSTQNNTLAVLYDLAPPERGRSVMKRLMSGDLNVQPYFMHFVLSALAHSGQFDEYGVGQMHRWKIDPDTQTFREMWDRGDYSHGWQCTPLFQMSSQILGVTPLSPGFQSFFVEPHLCGLSWAQGKVPTPHGEISERWSLSGKTFAMRLTVPPGTSASVSLHWTGRAFVDGKSTELPVSLSPGEHRVVAVYSGAIGY